MEVSFYQEMSETRITPGHPARGVSLQEAHPLRGEDPLTGIGLVNKHSNDEHLGSMKALCPICFSL